MCSSCVCGCILTIVCIMLLFEKTNFFHSCPENIWGTIQKHYYYDIMFAGLSNSILIDLVMDFVISIKQKMEKNEVENPQFPRSIMWCYSTLSCYFSGIEIYSWIFQKEIHWKYVCFTVQNFVVYHIKKYIFCY